ncbi:MAG: Asp-tRNA(Asn)/Glu-tRNA(Gln) amidotransferase subunit GatC [Rhodothermales bacterium]|nr:Asp-tRNA(Asn)/Glu-tRNA(Gln) amidotransferase subunit GatC [Rhodothermales bacterium]
MKVTKEQVRHIAALARLRFDREEEEGVAEELSRILDYVEKLNELDVSDVPPMAHVLDLDNVVRPDVVAARISREEALSNAPDADDTYFRVPKVIE